MRFEINLTQVSDLGLNALAYAIKGWLTAAGVLRHDEFVLTKLYRTA